MDLDLYTDYLLASFGKTTATGLSVLTDGKISHDAVTRFLSAEAFTSKDLWKQVKPLIHQIQETDACLILDDTIFAKPHTDENDLIGWHYDHVTGLNIKGINMVSAFYLTSTVSVPVGFELVLKTIRYADKEGKEKRKAERSKNEIFRDLVSVCVNNRLLFNYVLTDSWYTNAQNLNHVRKEKKN